jgi:hypothetical protein
VEKATPGKEGCLYPTPPSRRRHQRPALLLHGCCWPPSLPPPLLLLLPWRLQHQVLPTAPTHPLLLLLAACWYGAVPAAA